MAKWATNFGFELTNPRSYLTTARRLLVAALGFRSPREQIVASLIIGFVAILWSAASVGATLLIAVPALLILFPMGLLRYFLAMYGGL